VRRALRRPGRCSASVRRRDFVAEAGDKETQMTMKRGKAIGAALVASALLAALCGCQKQEGPAERAGKEIDKATVQAGQEIEKAGASIQDAAKGNKK